MTMTTVRQVVDAPARTPYRFGLFSVLDFLQDERAASGFQWEGAGCDVPYVYTSDCLLVGGNPALTVKDRIENSCDVRVADPFTVVAFDDASLGRDGGGAARAQANLTLGEQTTVEGYVISLIEAAAIDISVATGDLATQIGEIEADIESGGGEGIILVRRSTIALLPDYFVQTGSMLRTKLGTPVAALAAWTPARNAVVGLASLAAARSGISTGVGYKTDTNDNASFAERDYAFGWDCTPLIATPA